MSLLMVDFLGRAELFCSETNYLQFVECLLVLRAGGVGWTEHREPWVKSTIMGARVDLKHKEAPLLM